MTRAQRPSTAELGYQQIIKEQAVRLEELNRQLTRRLRDKDAESEHRAGSGCCIQPAPTESSVKRNS